MTASRNPHPSGHADAYRPCMSADEGDRYVVPGPHGGWDVARRDHARRSGHFSTPGEAERRALEIVEITGHGEGVVRIERDDGTLRSWDGRP